MGYITLRRTMAWEYSAGAADVNEIYGAGVAGKVST